MILIIAHYFIDIDDCAINPCQHGGTCKDGVNTHTCECAAGYVGANCDKGMSTYILYVVLCHMSFHVQVAGLVSCHQNIVQHVIMLY